MSTLRFRCSVLLVAALSLTAQEKEYKPKEEKLPGDPVAQPIAYSHKTHVAMGMKCANCHTMPGDGFAATFPKETMCMGCHATVKKESAEIQKLAAFAAKKEPVPWARVYKNPDIVWFNHSVHVKVAKTECAECHGDVGKRDILFQEKSLSMQTCMACHAKHEAPNGCDVCHASQ
ncbi:MAG: cytochrome c3 family protein [Bryobacterales bacterium]|nr:cytochrome c3 family protein [Bryobacterales bacterium]